MGNIICSVLNGLLPFILTKRVVFSSCTKAFLYLNLLFGVNPKITFLVFSFITIFIIFSSSISFVVNTFYFNILLLITLIFFTKIKKVINKISVHDLNAPKPLHSVLNILLYNSPYLLPYLICTLILGCLLEN